MEQQDIERIARATLRELGLPKAELTIAQVAGQPGTWRIDIRNTHGPNSLRIRCGAGTTPQWVREQIFNQYTSQG